MTNWLEWHCSDVNKLLLCYCSLHFWKMETSSHSLFTKKLQDSRLAICILNLGAYGELVTLWAWGMNKSIMFLKNWLEWHCSDVDKRLLCYCPLHCWRVEPPLLFLFLQRNFKILGKLYSKFGRLWWTSCPLGMGYE